MQFAEDRGSIFSVSIHPETGAVDEESIQNALNASERIKAIILIDPNNPTGFPLKLRFLNVLPTLPKT